MSNTLLFGYYAAAASVAVFIILWIVRKPEDEESEEHKDLSVSLPFFHHIGAYLSAGFVVLSLAYFFFTNYTMGTTRQWWLLDMFDSTMVKAYEAPMASPADGTVSDRFVQNYNRYLPEANDLEAPDGADVVHGERMYNTYCAPCHAVEGKGFGPVAKRSGTIPGIALSGSSGKSEGYLYLTIRNGGAVMPAYSWAMEDKEMWDVVAYLRSLFPAPVLEVEE
jgi:mono/diheme cytochrome c family protein